MWYIISKLEYDDVNAHIFEINVGPAFKIILRILGNAPYYVMVMSSVLLFCFVQTDINKRGNRGVSILRWVWHEHVPMQVSVTIFDPMQKQTG